MKMLAFAYRYNSFFNYLSNRFRFKNLKCGKGVVVNLNQGQFLYDAGVWIAEGTRIDIFNSQVQISAGVNICRNNFIAPTKSGIKIGKRTKLQEFGRLVGEITIGDDVIIAPNFYMSSGIHVFNQEPHTLINIQDQIYSSDGEKCTIEDDCWIGINVCVMPGVKIKRGCIIGAGSVVTRSTEPYGIYGGIPAKKIGTRLTLEAKTALDANIPEHLPYFYRGFDHFNYKKNKDEYKGALAQTGYFSFYTELPQIKSIVLEVEAFSHSSAHIKYGQDIFNLKSGKNEIEIKNIEIIDKLVTLETTDKLIIKKVFFS